MIAIKFYSQFPDSPEMQGGINPNWPAETRTISDQSEADQAETVMSESDFNLYTQNLADDVRSWLEAREG